MMVAVWGGGALCEATLRVEAARKASEEPPEDPEEAETLGRQESGKSLGEMCTTACGLSGNSGGEGLDGFRVCFVG